MSDFQMQWHVGDDWGEWGSRPRKPLVQFDFAHKGEWMDSVIGPHPVTGKDMIFHVVRCELCICTHLWPLATPEELAQYYRSSFYETVKPQYLEQYEQDKSWWLAVHRTVLDVAQRWLPRPYGVVSMLDVGAGPGYPLDVGAERGFHTVAVEPSEMCRDFLHAKGHRVFHGTMTDFLHVRGRYNDFDLLYAYEVLEHQPNPEEFLLQCYDLLVPGGVLVVCVPSDFTQGQAEACERFDLPSWYISAPDHQHYFTPATLKLMLRRCGFQIRYIRMTAPLIETFMLEEGKCYVGDPLLGRQCHLERMCAELAAIKDGTWPDLEAEYIANVERRVGREIIGIFSKDISA